MSHSPGPFPGPSPLHPPGGPPRRRVPWWVWLASGCGGCALVAVIALVAGGIWIGNFAQGIARDVGPVSEARARRDLGPEVPIYPGSSFDQESTKGALIGLGFVKKAGGKNTEGLFGGAAVYATSDSAEEVYAFYNRELPKRGWRIQSYRGGARQQAMYEKGGEFIAVQIQPGGGGRSIVLMRGKKEPGMQAPEAGTGPTRGG